MYVVTGASGHTGRIIANGLLAKGQKVRVVGRNAEHLKDLAAKGAEVFVGQLSDSNAMSKALTGAKAAYLMLPPDIRNENYRAYQDQLSEVIGAAVENSKLKYVVVLSSVGADKPDKTGPVAGLHNLEQRLNRIANLNALYLRPAYFMENTLMQSALIRMFGMTAGPLRPDLVLPMIATRDIGDVALEELLALKFKGKETRELLGQRDLTMNEVAAIIGKALGNPDLQYMQSPDDQVRGGMISMGMSANMANLILEMAAAMNSGHMIAIETRSAQNTTPTSYETFVAEEFVPNYLKAAA